MAITLNGTTGITTPDVASDGLTVDSTTLVVDEANNRVGIGTSSPQAPLHVTGTIKVATGNAQGILGLGEAFGSTANVGLWRGAANAPTTDGNFLNLGGYDGIVFATGAAAIGSQTERARIDSSGYLWIKSTGGTSPWDATSGTYAKFGDIYPIGATAQSSIVAIFNRNTSTGALVECKYNGAVVGSISVTGSSTAYNTSSDYRLKEDWQPMTGASERVKALKPVNFAWKVDGSRVDGFLAHEAQAVVPEAVTGEKDAVETYTDDEGNEQTRPVYQGIDQSKLVPLLTAALQEALAEIETLKARVSALEAA